MEQAYLVGSILVGLVVILDGAMLLKLKGEASGSKLVAATSTVEFLWAVVSIVAVFALSFSREEILSPVLFITHNVLGWLYGVYLAPKYLSGSDIEFALFSVPGWYAMFGFSLGIVYTFLNIYLVLR